MIIMITFGNVIKWAMRKKISVVGLLFVLLFRYPPIPKFNIFHIPKIEIVQACKLSIRQLALQFHLN